jgi:hypothetical protein
MITLIAAALCHECMHPFSDHIPSVGCSHVADATDNEIKCVCMGYQE